MKKLIVILMAIVMVAGISTRIMAQNNAKALNVPVGATIVPILAIANDQNLEFGTMSVPSGPVNLVLATDKSRTPDVAGNIALIADALNPVLNAHYNVTGSTNYTYAITLPADNTVTITSGSNTMKVDAFTAKSKNTGVDGIQGKLSGGVDEITVGATLKLATLQPAGVYEGHFDVTIFYN